MSLKPVLAVESYLSDVRSRNLAANIWASNNEIIERLLEAGGDLESAWVELLTALPPGEFVLHRTTEKWQAVVDTIIDVAAGWSPKKIKETRAAIGHVSDLTVAISKKASKLAELLRRRTAVLERHGISKSPMDNHPIDLFEPAARIADGYDHSRGSTYYRFAACVLPELSRLSERFDLKYWPCTADLIEAIAQANDAPSLSVDSLSDTAIAIPQASTRDFMRALDGAIDELKRDGITISFSHAAYATVVNAAIGLDGQETPESIKKYRADERRRKR